MSARLDQEHAEGPLVTGFVGRGFRVGGDVHLDGLLLTPDRALGWSAPALEALTVEALGEILAIDPAPEFLLLGTGATLRRPGATFVAALEASGTGLELMDSRTAARAWAVLRSEGRQVVAALLPLEAATRP